MSLVTPCFSLDSDEGLADEEQLQSWFLDRVNTFLKQHNRRLVGWDEVQGGVETSWEGLHVKPLSQAGGVAPQQAHMLALPRGAMLLTACPRPPSISKVICRVNGLHATRLISHAPPPPCTDPGGGAV